MISTNELSAGTAAAGPKPSRAEVSRRNYAQKIKRLPGEPVGQGFKSERYRLAICPLAQAAKELGVTRQAAHQLERTAFWKIREALKSPGRVAAIERQVSVAVKERLLRTAMAYAAARTSDPEAGARLVEEKYAELYEVALEKALQN